MGLLDSLGGILVGAAAAGPVGAVAGAVAANSRPVQKAVTGAAEFTVETLGTGAKVIRTGATTVLDATGDAIAAAYNVIRGVVAFRALRPSEITLAEKVYKSRLPLDRVVISSLAGVSGRPLTVPGSMLMAWGSKIPGIAPLLLLDWYLRGLQNKYIIFAGEDGYNQLVKWNRDKRRQSLTDLGAKRNQRDGSMFVHELAHVWQGHYGTPWAYVLDSIWSQCSCALSGESAYTVTTGAQWRDYNPEQQARIVESWYIMNFDKMDPIGHPFEDYMTCNIWAGNPNAKTIFTPVRVTGTPLHTPNTGVHLPQNSLQTTAKALEAQAKALDTQARALMASGNPVLIAQGRALQAQSAALMAQSRAILSSTSAPKTLDVGLRLPSAKA